MSRCPHNNVQQFTEMCLDCGRNVYETDDEYLQALLEEKARRGRSEVREQIEKLEKELRTEPEEPLGMW